MGLCVGSIAAWKAVPGEAVPGADGTGHVQPESLAVYVDQSIRGEQVRDVLEKVKAARYLPTRIKVDNGPAFISRALDAWAYCNKVKPDDSLPGTPCPRRTLSQSRGSQNNGPKPFLITSVLPGKFQ